MRNVVILTGRLTADPELRQTPAGKFVCSFNIAVQRDKSPKKLILSRLKHGTIQLSFARNISTRVSL